MVRPSLALPRPRPARLPDRGASRLVARASSSPPRRPSPPAGGDPGAGSVDGSVDGSRDGFQLGFSPEEVEAADCSYGFHSSSEAYFENERATTPGNVFTLGFKNFVKEFKALQAYTQEQRAQDGGGLLGGWGGSLAEDLPSDEEICTDVFQMLEGLKLDPDKVWARELAREKSNNPLEVPSGKASLVVKVAYVSLCWLLDRVFSDQDAPMSRFWFLETVARMPYFSYISMLHLYETFGWFRAGAELKRIHFAEEWNEFHHLLIMESLGGDSKWKDRFMANHAAVFYYWVLNLFWLLSPVQAYAFSELIERHAVDTYTEFVEENEELLKQLPAPQVARMYYQGEDLYMFDEFQTSRGKGRGETRRPKIETLYDTFCNVRDDEREHVKTMVACQVYGTSRPVTSPHRAKK